MKKCTHLSLLSLTLTSLCCPLDDVLMNSPPATDAQKSIESGIMSWGDAVGDSSGRRQRDEIKGTDCWCVMLRRMKKVSVSTLWGQSPPRIDRISPSVTAEPQSGQIGRLVVWRRVAKL